MEYLELADLLHKDPSNNRFAAAEAELERRKAIDSTFLIKPVNGSEDLFIAMPREMVVLIEQILQAEQAAASMMQEVPAIGQRALVRGLVLDEVVSTNAIENINSTRKQIEDALEASDQSSGDSRRFKELAVLYMGLAHGASIELPKTPKDIRDIYDMVMEGELDEAKQPDGDLFRKSGVETTAGGMKVVHVGVEPEEKIIEGLANMLALTQRADIPQLVSSIASHFIFESIHPFYDGNGRTGRYLLALFLTKTLSTPTVLSLSRAISEKKNKYYEAFSSVENPLNHGEMTHFVYALLELIRRAQVTTIERLRSSINSYARVGECCQELFAQMKLLEKEKDIITVLSQYDLFGLVGSVLLDDLASAIDLKNQMTRKHLVSLEKKGLVEVVSKRPLKFALTPAAEEALGISGEE